MAPLLASAQVSEGVIAYYEAVSLQFAYADSQFSGQDSSAPVASATLEFVAFGRSFEAELTRNFELTHGLPADVRSSIADIQLWEGSLTNLPGSWVRLARQGEYVSGAIWDGAELYRLERYEYAADRLLTPDTGFADSTIIYTMPGLLAHYSDIVVGNVAAASTIDGRKSGSPSEVDEKPALSEGLELEMGIVADVEFVDRFDSRAAAEALSEINVADAVFVQQVGVHLVVSELEVFATEPDPFDSTDAVALLDELASFKAGQPEFAALDLAHLFTDRTLDDGILGIARVGAVCAARDGVGLSSEGHFSTHEIAHNLGAPHDTEPGSPCESAEPGHIMDLTPQGGENSQKFTVCSIDQMLQTISHASCLSPVPSNDMALQVIRAPESAAGNSEFDVYFQLVSTGTEDVLAVEVNFESPNASFNHIRWITPTDPVSCYLEQTPVLCTTHRIVAGRPSSIQVSVEATQVGPVEISANAWSLNDSNPTNNSDAVVVDVTPAVRLNTTEFVVSPELAVPGQAVVLSTTMVNAGITDATNVLVQIDSMPDFFEFVSAALPGGRSCDAQSVSGPWLCPIGNLLVGQQRQLEFELEALAPVASGDDIQSGTFEISYSADEVDLGPGSAAASLNVSAAFADGRLAVTMPRTTVYNGSHRIDFTIQNQGPDVMRGFDVLISHPGLVVNAWSDHCNIDDQPRATHCFYTLDLAPGESASFWIGGPTPQDGSYVVSASLTFPARDPEPGNNSATMNWSVVTPQAGGTSRSGSGGGGGGGGGGAMSLLVTLLLLVVRLARASRQWRASGGH
jgi:uncharacterized repeat protein (TIGR01451 family)